MAVTDPAPPQMKVGIKPITVTRVNVTLPPLDEDYNHVELILDGESYYMGGPHAQQLGQLLNRAGGGDPVAHPSNRKDVGG